MAARFVDELGDHYFDPRIESSIQEICDLVDKLESNIKSLPTIDDQLDSILRTLDENASLRRKVEQFAAGAYELAKEFNATNIDSQMEFVDITIENMKTTIRTIGPAAASEITRMHTRGESVDVSAEQGAKLRVEDSSFTGNRSAFGVDGGLFIESGPRGKVGFSDK